MIRGKDGERQAQPEITWRELKKAATTDLDALLGAATAGSPGAEDAQARARADPPGGARDRASPTYAAAAPPWAEPPESWAEDASPPPPALSPGPQPAWLALGQELIVEEARRSQQRSRQSQPEYQPDSPVLLWGNGGAFAFSSDSLDGGARAAAARPPDDLVLTPQGGEPEDEMVLHDSPDGDAPGQGEAEDDGGLARSSPTVRERDR